MPHGITLPHFAPRPWFHRRHHRTTSPSCCLHRNLWAPHSSIACSYRSLGIPDDDAPDDTDTLACGHRS
ncbi:hypothetical protein NDU88_003699 [Pleurodeles waltl]|uniref:Uncharacterized protein n=1 Tax=Pleurodeles waltl TaxID=8319 RepID=A0AAV7T639_PLEWA|nr:hypothetical protein NDU88_003699 [Pleurodeles waltl]